MPVVVLGTLALAGFVTVRRALDSTTDADVEPALDITEIRSAVEERGLRAVTETDTLEAAVNDDELDAPIDVQRLQSAVEEQLAGIERNDIESVLADELNAATDRGLSAISEQEIIEGTVEGGEIGVSIDMNELKSVLESGTGVLERTTDAIAERVIEAETDGSMLDTGNESMEGGQRIAVVDEQGNLESLVDENEPAAADSDPQPIDIENGDDQPDESNE
jgi:hypothetical protein